MTIGTLVRSEHDDFAVAVDFSAVDVFTASAVTGATVAQASVSPTTGSPANLTLGTPSVAANVVTFRVSGGTAGFAYHVTVTATNGTDTVCRSIDVPTEAC